MERRSFKNCRRSKLNLNRWNTVALVLLLAGLVMESLLITNQENHLHARGHYSGWLHVHWSHSATTAISWTVVALVLATFLFATEQHWFWLCGGVIAVGVLIQAEWGHDLPSPQNQGIFWAGFGLGALWLAVSAMRNHNVFERIGRRVGLVT
jgi:hypothetical protein